MKTLTSLTYGLLIAISTAGIAFAQASGNFTYATSGNGQNAINCTLNNNGTITGGAICGTSSLGGASFACTSDAQCTSLVSGATCNTGTGMCVFPFGGGAVCSKTSDCKDSGLCVIQSGNTSGTCAIGTCGGNFQAGIHTSSGAGNVFVIRPSMVVGLLTDVVVSSKSIDASGQSTSSSLAGVSVNVNIGAESGQGKPTVIPNFGVTYDARYVQISTNLFSVLGATCTNAVNGCFISFDESTVSAHSFDWIVTNLSSGNYGISMNWNSNVNGSGTFESLTCVGPVNMTVEQNKIFHQNEVNSM